MPIIEGMDAKGIYYKFDRGNHKYYIDLNIPNGRQIAYEGALKQAQVLYSKGI